MARLRVLIGDDHPLTLQGVTTVLEPHYDIVGTASDGRTLVESALRLRPDLVILDVSMPEVHGVEAARQITAAVPSAKLIFLSMHTNTVYVREALNAGGRAYVRKAGAVGELLDAIRRVLAGEIYISPGLSFSTAGDPSGSSGRLARSPKGLTVRQLEILQLIADGRLSKEIAHILGISIKTVDFHRARIMARLGARSVAEVIRIALEREWIVIPESKTKNQGS
jgi:DNA-binding NarL/FixJ family response regulator